MSRVRIGIIGTSWFADRYHFPLFTALEEHAEITALCGRNKERADEIAEKYRVPNVFSDYKKLLSSDLIDGVVIVTPDDLHYSMATEAIRRNLHVFCEKPISYTLSEARAMREAARSAGVVTLVDHTYRWLPIYVYARQLLHEGRIGKLHRGLFHYLAGNGREKSDAWRFDASRGNGVLGDLGSHMMDLARFLIGDIVEVNPRLDVHVPHRSDVDLIAPNDLASIIVRFADGETGEIVASKIDCRNGQRVELHGSEGSINIEWTFTESQIRCISGEELKDEVLEVPVELGGSPTIDEMLDHYSTYDAGPRLFVRSILGDAAAAPTFDDGYRVQQVIQAAVDSNATGCRVSIDLD